MQKIFIVFVFFISLIIIYILNTDISYTQPTDMVKKDTTTKVKKENKSSSNNVKIEYSKKNVKSVNENSKKDFDEYISSNIQQMHTISSTKVNEYELSIKTLTEPVKNQFSPPSFPTIISGELNGNRFSLKVDDDAKSQNIYLVVSKNSQEAVINVDTLQNVEAGQIVDIGNLNPPEYFNSESISDFVNESTDVIEQNVEIASNSNDKSSIAPPPPPVLGR